MSLIHRIVLVLEQVYDLLHHETLSPEVRAFCARTIEAAEDLVRSSGLEYGPEEPYDHLGAACFSLQVAEGRLEDGEVYEGTADLANALTHLRAVAEDFATV